VPSSREVAATIVTTPPNRLSRRSATCASTRSRSPAAIGSRAVNRWCVCTSPVGLSVPATSAATSNSSPVSGTNANAGDATSPETRLGRVSPVAAAYAASRAPSTANSRDSLLPRTASPSRTTGSACPVAWLSIAFASVIPGPPRRLRRRARCRRPSRSGHARRPAQGAARSRSSPRSSATPVSRHATSVPSASSTPAANASNVAATAPDVAGRPPAPRPVDGQLDRLPAEARAAARRGTSPPTP
jgi:hypothetical protein